MAQMYVTLFDCLITIDCDQITVILTQSPLFCGTITERYRATVSERSSVPKLLTYFTSVIKLRHCLNIDLDARML